MGRLQLVHCIFLRLVPRLANTRLFGPPLSARDLKDAKALMGEYDSLRNAIGALQSGPLSSWSASSSGPLVT